MENQLYSYEEACELIQEKGLKMTTDRYADIDKVCKFGDHGSILNVNTLLYSRYQLHATEKDYNYIKRMAEADNLAIVLRETDVNEIEEIISGYEEVGSKAILFIKNANRVLQMNDTPKNLPHEIIFFTNENLSFVLDCLCENAVSKTKPKPVAPIIKATKIVEPELTDDEIKNIYPEGCTVTHTKYGQGIVKSVSTGRITVEFADSVEKILGAKICIKNKLLTVA